MCSALGGLIFGFILIILAGLAIEKYIEIGYRYSTQLKKKSQRSVQLLDRPALIKSECERICAETADLLPGSLVKVRDLNPELIVEEDNQIVLNDRLSRLLIDNLVSVLHVTRDGSLIAYKVSESKSNLAADVFRVITKSFPMLVNYWRKLEFTLPISQEELVYLAHALSEANIEIIATTVIDKDKNLHRLSLISE